MRGKLFRVRANAAMQGWPRFQHFLAFSSLLNRVLHFLRNSCARCLVCLTPVNWGSSPRSFCFAGSLNRGFGCGAARAGRPSVAIQRSLVYWWASVTISSVTSPTAQYHLSYDTPPKVS